MSDLVVRFACKPGAATPELAIECQRKVLDLLNAIAADVSPGAVTFTLQHMEWIDDGTDEIVVRVTTGGPS